MAVSTEGRNQTTCSKEDDSERSIQLQEAKPITIVCDETTVEMTVRKRSAEI